MAIGSRGVLAARVRSQCEELDRVASYLDVDPLRTALPELFVQRLRTQLTNAAAELRKALTKNESSGWTAFDNAEPGARRLCAEVFTLLQGELFSSAGLDDGISAAARNLLAQVQQRCGVDRGVLTSFSPEPESLDHTIGLVRLMFPGTTVWDLPFAVHEFGHHAVRELEHIAADRRQENPLLDVITGQDGVGAGLTELHAHELAADAFATFALGATYPYACIVQRISAKKLTADSGTHPSWSRRMVVMLATLQRMSLAYDNTRYADAATETVLPLWQSLAGPRLREPTDQRRLEVFARRMVEKLHRHATGLGYDDADKAVLVKGLLENENTVLADLPDKTQAAAVVDAAWRWRRRFPEAPEWERKRVNALAIEFCRATNG